MEQAFLSEIYPGISVDHVLLNMRWDPLIQQPIGLTSAFTDEEIGALRAIDPDGFWTGAAATAAAP